MNKAGVMFLVCLALNCWTFPVQAQENEDLVRGSFLSSRPAKATSPAPKNTPRPGAKQDPKTKTGTVKNNPPGVAATETVMGIGYTIFMQDANGQPMRVDAAREFRTGDAIRINVEPNQDGFLYIFHTENDANPLLLFPDARLQGGSNAVRAHVPYEVPSSTDPQQELRWFVFEGTQAVEKVYIVVTRQPLAGVPTGSALAEYAQTHPDAPNWKPTEDIWSLVQTDSKNPVVVSKLKNLGQLQTKMEKTAITRALGLPKTAPPPAVVCLSKQAGSDHLVTIVDLAHK